VGLLIPGSQVRVLPGGLSRSSIDGVLLRHRSPRRRGPLVAALVLVALSCLGAAGGVVWLAAHLVPHVHDEAPIADAVEVLKFALVTGLNRWTDVA
jgi:hypothetical protein